MKTIGYYKFALKVAEKVALINEKLPEIKTIQEAKDNLRAIEHSYDLMESEVGFLYAKEGMRLLDIEYDKLKRKAYDIKDEISENTLPQNVYTNIELFYKDIHYFNVNAAICRVHDILKNTFVDDFSFIYKVFERNMDEILVDTNDDLYDALFEHGNCNEPTNKEEAIRNMLCDFKKQMYDNKDRIMAIAKTRYNISFVKED